MNRRRMSRVWVIVVLGWAAGRAAAIEASPSPSPAPAASPSPSPAGAAEETILDVLQTQAKACAVLVKTEAAQSFVRSVAALPQVAPRTFYYNKDTETAYSPSEAAALSEAERAACKAVTYDESFYYFTRYGTPLIYTRPLDLYASAADVTSFAGRRVFDFGFGGIGHLRLLAAEGADAVGVEVDPILRAFYSEPADQGEVATRSGGAGRVTLLFGKFPADPAVQAAVGDGYDLFLSKNVLKRGYIHPEREAPPKYLVHLEVEDEAFVRAVWNMLKPGGHMLVYNICPAPAPLDQPYIPWADGRFPFERELVERVGFEVIAWDEDDFPAVYALWSALGYAEGKSSEELHKELFAHYTLLRKPTAARG